jgi:hypothetical protein
MNARTVTLALSTLLASLLPAHAQVNVFNDQQCQQVADQRGFSALVATAAKCSSSACSAISIITLAECSAIDIIGICCYNSGGVCFQICVTRAAHPH